jgi:thiosulfate/3-mercaptopyruvate sulfurtransferase
VAHATLVSTAELARHPEWRVFDCRHDLARPYLGEQQYAHAHIPGALFAHLDRDLSARPSGSNGRHPLPDPAAFAAWLGRQGLRAGDQVIAYDANNGAMASRLWWMLRWVGHEAVAVLDGGLAKWLEEERAVTAEVPAFAATLYVARPRPALRADVEYVEQHLESAGMLLVDARAPVRFRGEAEPIDPVAGRIPGALNRFNGDNLTPDGIFKAPEALKKEFGALLGDRDPAEVVHYCGSGVAACHNLLAMEIAGLSGSRIYAGSWSEWIAEARRPQAKGNA